MLERVRLEVTTHGSGGPANCAMSRTPVTHMAQPPAHITAATCLLRQNLLLYVTRIVRIPFRDIPHVSGKNLLSH